MCVCVCVCVLVGAAVGVVWERILFSCCPSVLTIFDGQFLCVIKWELFRRHIKVLNRVAKNRLVRL